MEKKREKPLNFGDWFQIESIQQNHKYGQICLLLKMMMFPLPKKISKKGHHCNLNNNKHGQFLHQSNTFDSTHQKTSVRFEETQQGNP